jgi:23S rRNA pseudouridine1911/1915/1917 synthase
MRIDKFLSERLDEVSREYIQDLIKHRQVFKNSIEVKKSREMVSVGDIVEVNIVDIKKQSYQNISKESIENIVQGIHILYEHQDFIVVLKPAGILVHKTNNLASYSLVDYLVSIYPEIQTIQDETYTKEALVQQRYGIVHRLDKDTSGVMIVARTQKGYNKFKSLFKNRNIHKEYICLVRGQITQPSGHIQYPIARSKLDHTKRIAVTHSKQQTSSQRIAHTEYYVEKTYPDSTLLKVILHTGRTHQIRVHLKAIGHPIIGDKLYGGKQESMNSQLSRQFLHAHRIRFIYDGQEYSFKAELTSDLRKYIQQSYSKK